LVSTLLGVSRPVTSVGGRYWVVGAGCWVVGTGCWVVGTGYWVLGAGYWAAAWVLGTGYWVLGGGLGTGWSVTWVVGDLGGLGRWESV